MKRVLAVFAHPDDESFAAAGFLAACAQRGAEVQVVSMTRGEAGRSAIPCRDLGALRIRELTQACEQIGAQNPTVLGFPDGGLEEVGEIDLAGALSELIRARSPDLVLTMGHDGAYGHRDHIVTTAAVTSSLDNAGEHPAGLLHVEFAKGVMAPVWRSIRKIPALVDPHIGEEDLGVDAADVDVRFELGPLAWIKQRAVACHRSQLPDGAANSFLRPGLLEALLAEEWLCWAPGRPHSSRSAGARWLRSEFSR